MSAPATAPAATLPGDDKRRGELLSNADSVENLLMTSMEAGLFGSGDAAHQPEQILDKIRDARQQAESGRLADAARSLAEAEATVHQAVRSKGFTWRAIRMHQLHMFAYYLAILWLILNTATGWWWFRFVARRFWVVPTSVMAFGALGAVLRGLWWLHRQVAKGIFRPQFTLAHLVAPWIGALFGAGVFLLLKGGFLALQPGTGANIDDAAIPMAIAFLSGFSWEWALGRIDRSVRGDADRTTTSKRSDQTAPVSPGSGSDTLPQPTQGTSTGRSGGAAPAAATGGTGPNAATDDGRSGGSLWAQRD